MEIIVSQDHPLLLSYRMGATDNQCLPGRPRYAKDTEQKEIILTETFDGDAYLNYL